MKKHKYGFSVIEILIVVIGLAAVAASVWYVNRPEQVPNAPQPIQIQASDSTKSFTFNYPDTWEIEPYEWVSNGDEGGPAAPEPDWTIESKPITLRNRSNNKATISIRFAEVNNGFGGRERDATSYDELIKNIQDDYFFTNTFTRITINGNEALYDREDYLGPPDAKVESHVSYYYYFIKDSKMLVVNFVEKYHHDWAPENDFNHSEFTQDFDQIAKTINFN